MDDDEILAFLDDGDRELLAEEDAEQPRLAAVVSATEYTVALPKEDAEALGAAGKWEHLEGVLYRRRCTRVTHEKSEGIITFTINTGDANVDDVIQALAEELDEITGRKMEAGGAEAWGMF